MPIPTPKEREVALRKANREIRAGLWERDAACDMGRPIDSKIRLNPVDRRGNVIERFNRHGELNERLRYIDHLGSVHYGIVEHCGIYEGREKDRRHIGEWMKPEITRLHKQVGDIPAHEIKEWSGDSEIQDHGARVIVSESLQSPQNTAANHRKWTGRATKAARQAKAYKSLTKGARVSKADRESTAIVVDQAEAAIPDKYRTANDYRKYFR